MLVCLLALVDTAARAQDAGVCTDETGEGPIEMTPASNSRGVTLDSFIKWRYTPGYFVGWMTTREIPFE